MKAKEIRNLVERLVGDKTLLGHLDYQNRKVEVFAKEKYSHYGHQNKPERENNLAYIIGPLAVLLSLYKTEVTTTNLMSKVSVPYEFNRMTRQEHAKLTVEDREFREEFRKRNPPKKLEGFPGSGLWTPEPRIKNLGEYILVDELKDEQLDTADVKEFFALYDFRRTIGYKLEEFQDPTWREYIGGSLGSSKEIQIVTAREIGNYPHNGPIVEESRFVATSFTQVLPVSPSIEEKTISKLARLNIFAREFEERFRRLSE